MDNVVKGVQNMYKSLQPQAAPIIAETNNQTGIVSNSNIVKYSKYAGAAYKIFSTVWSCTLNCFANDTKNTEIDYHWAVSGAPSYGFVAHKDDTKEIIVSWRGSVVIMDWIADFKFAPTVWPISIKGSFVHKGFLNAYKGASENIKNVVSKLVDQYPDYKIVLTGHSLGGAEAALAAVDFTIEHPEWANRIELYTYGEPRVGNSVFADWLSSQPFPIYRVVNQGDLVPRVPPQIMGYQHHAQEVWYKEDSESPQFCGKNAESLDCQAGLSTSGLSLLNHLTYPGLGYEVIYAFLANMDIDK
ncbi:hypothetical protein GGI07_001462 [Coemansia sp. Benny D115]|nr:hypothetical protein GGI07_001462 [Coemansia sp. Benny D115]